METSIHSLYHLNGKPCSHQTMSAERKDKELRSMFCALSCLRSSPDRAERSVPCLCHMLLSLDWCYQKGHPGTRKRAGWLLLTKTLLLHRAVELSRRKYTLPSCTGATVHSCSRPRLCLFSSLMSTVPIKNPVKHTQTAPYSCFSYKHHLPIRPGQPPGTSQTPSSPCHLLWQSH